jgi:phosphomannomutase/phosphoglucomutase
MEVFGSSGVRGTVGETITPTFVGQVARAAGSEWFSAGTRTVAIARDTRRTGEMLADAAAAELAAVGCDVRRLGVVPTPGTQAYCAREGLPALMITASHNPPRYNGVKLIGADGHELSREALERIEARLLRSDRDGSGSSVSWDRVGRAERAEDAERRYVEELLSAVDREAIASADLTVALDPGHGAGAVTSPTFLRKLGCEVVTINAQPDGNFPGRDPEPVEENLSELGELVRASDADVGVAHDGDADRAVFFDESGRFLDGEAVLAALAAAVLEPGDATVSAVNVSQRLVDVAGDAGADLELTPIGSTYIVTRILELTGEGRRVPVAGEGNGGVLFPPYRPARDGAYTAARFLELLADRPASEVVAPYDDYENVRINIPYEEASTRRAMLDAAEAYAREADAELTTIDGYRLDYGDAWVLARPSGTEPLVRVYAEARSRERAAELADRMRDALESAAETALADD